MVLLAARFISEQSTIRDLLENGKIIFIWSLATKNLSNTNNLIILWLQCLIFTTVGSQTQSATPGERRKRTEEG